MGTIPLSQHRVRLGASRALSNAFVEAMSMGAKKNMNKNIEKWVIETFFYDNRKVITLLIYQS